MDETGRFFITADEGDTRNAAGQSGVRGGRTISVFDAQTGAFIADTGAQLDDAAAAAGVYPDLRSNRGGSEPEGFDLIQCRRPEARGRRSRTSRCDRVGQSVRPHEARVVHVAGLQGGIGPETVKFFRRGLRLFLASGNEVSGTVSFSRWCSSNSLTLRPVEDKLIRCFTRRQSVPSRGPRPPRKWRVSVGPHRGRRRSARDIHARSSLKAQARAVLSDTIQLHTQNWLGFIGEPRGSPCGSEAVPSNPSAASCMASGTTFGDHDAYNLWEAPGQQSRWPPSRWRSVPAAPSELASHNSVGHRRSGRRWQRSKRRGRSSTKPGQAVDSCRATNESVRWSDHSNPPDHCRFAQLANGMSARKWRARGR